MKRVLAYCCSILLLTLISLPLQAASPYRDTLSLTSAIDTLIKYELPRGSEVGILIYDLTARRPLYAYQADHLGHPASTMKLLTTITALSRPDANEPFRTEVWAQGRIAGDTLHGNLYVVGGMDPEFSDADLDTLVARTARAGFHTIAGQVCGDVSKRDSLYWGSGWLWDDNPADYQPYLSPLMLEKGVVTVTARATQAGDTASLVLTPASGYYTVRNLTQSRTPSARRFRVDRNWLEGGNEITVEGNVNGTLKGRVNIAHSERFFMHTFVERLRRANVRCADYQFAPHRPDSTSVFLARVTTSVQTVVNGVMKHSDNLNAEAMLNRLGYSTCDGLSAVCRLLRKQGLNPADYRLADGCGLSNYNYISPEVLVAMLRYAHSRTDIFQKLYKALPVGGVDGTLKYRMKRGTPSYQTVHAKTGSFTGVNCLAGYLQRRADSHWIAFAIMNQNVLSARKARDFQDAVTDLIITKAPQDR